MSKALSSHKLLIKQIACDNKLEVIVVLRLRHTRLNHPGSSGLDGKRDVELNLTEQIGPSNQTTPPSGPSGKSPQRHAGIRMGPAPSRPDNRLISYALGTHFTQIFIVFAQLIKFITIAWIQRAIGARRHG